MTVGYVHFSGLMGDAVRIAAIRRFFEENQIAYQEFRLTHNRERVDIIRETLSPSGLKHITRKVFIDRAHPFLKEINWHVEVRQWEESVEKAVRELAPQINSVDVFHGELIFGGLVCRRLKELSGKPYVYDMHGLISEEAKLTGSNEYTQACKRWETGVVSGADRIIVVTEAMRQDVHEIFGIPLEKIIVCPNGSYTNNIQPRYNNPLQVLYAGNFAPYENVMSFVKTAELMYNQPVRFILIGDGAQRNELFDYINKNFVSVIYLGKKKYDEIFNIFGQMQVGFFGQVGGMPWTGHPIKILDYASCGLPIIAGPGPWAEPIKRYNCGIIVDGASPEQFAEGLELFTNQKSWELMSQNAKEMIRQLFQWKDVLLPLKDLYSEQFQS